MVYAANGIFRGLQKVRITLIAAVGGVVVNTVLDVLFVIVLNWGIAGSGVATLVAQWFMGLFLAQSPPFCGPGRMVRVCGLVWPVLRQPGATDCHCSFAHWLFVRPW